MEFTPVVTPNSWFDRLLAKETSPPDLTAWRAVITAIAMGTAWRAEAVIQGPVLDVLREVA